MFTVVVTNVYSAVKKKKDALSPKTVRICLGSFKNHFSSSLIQTCFSLENFRTLQFICDSRKDCNADSHIGICHKTCLLSKMSACIDIRPLGCALYGPNSARWQHRLANSNGQTFSVLESAICFMKNLKCPHRWMLGLPSLRMGSIYLSFASECDFHEHLVPSHQFA